MRIYWFVFLGKAALPETNGCKPEKQKNVQAYQRAQAFPSLRVQLLTLYDSTVLTNSIKKKP